MNLENALRRLYGRQLIKRMLPPGMLVERYPALGAPKRTERVPTTRRGTMILESETICIEDPATKGCLLALLREARNKPGLYVAHLPGGHPDRTNPDGGVRWLVSDYLSIGPHHNALTEGKALAHDLIETAEAP